MDKQSRTVPVSLTCLLALAIVTGISSTSAAGITYTVDRVVGPGAITGTIETNGATGVLTAADIIDWNLNVDADGIPATSGQLLGPLSGNNSSITFLSGNALTATPTGMFFDFSLSGILQIITPDSNVAWQLQAGIPFSDELIRESLFPDLIQAYVGHPAIQEQIASATAVPPPPGGSAVQILPIPPGSSFGFAQSINKKGQIVGLVQTPCPVCSLGAFWDGHAVAAPTLLPVPPVPFPGGTASSINDKGQIVGTIEPPPPGLLFPLPAFWEGPDATAPTVLPFPSLPAGEFGTGGGTATSINEKGQIVGSVATVGVLFGRPPQVPAFWEGPHATAPTILAFPPLPPGPFGSGGGGASSINKKGQIVGSVLSGNGSSFPSSVPAFWEGPDATAPTILPFPLLPPGPFGSGGGGASSINDKGQIVGTVFQAGSPFPTQVPALWEGPNAIAPTILPFPPVAPGPFALSGYAFSINDKGQVVGYFQGQEGALPVLWATRTGNKQE